MTEDRGSRRELLKRLAATPSALPVAAPSGATPSRAAGSATAGSTTAAAWTLPVVIGHLLHVEQEVWRPRLEAMLGGDVPRWDLWEPDGIDWTVRYSAADPGELRERLRDERRRTVERLRGLDDAAWAQRAWHATFGDLDVTGLLRQALRHDAEHLRQVGEL